MNREDEVAKTETKKTSWKLAVVALCAYRTYAQQKDCPYYVSVDAVWTDDFSGYEVCEHPQAKIDVESKLGDIS